MKKLIVTLTLCSTNLSYAADRYVTFVKAANDTSSVSQSIAAGEVVTYVLAHSSASPARPTVDVIIGAITFPMNQINTYRSHTGGGLGFYQWSIAGPCKVKLTGTTGIQIANNSNSVISCYFKGEWGARGFAQYLIHLCK